MGFDDKLLGNMTAIFSTVYNFSFCFMTGEQLNLALGLFSLVFTGLINMRRAMREVNQLLKIFAAKTNREAEKLMQEDLEKDEADGD